MKATLLDPRFASKGIDIENDEPLMQTAIENELIDELVGLVENSTGMFPF